MVPVSKYARQALGVAVSNLVSTLCPKVSLVLHCQVCLSSLSIQNSLVNLEPMSKQPFDLRSVRFCSATPVSSLLPVVQLT